MLRSIAFLEARDIAMANGALGALDESGVVSPFH
jgi:hypothetical protein